MNLKNYFDKGLNYNDYLKKVNNQLETLEKTDKDSFLIPHYSLNLQRMKRLNKTFNLSEEQKNALKNISTDFELLTISEGWCGDAAQSLPILNVIMNELGVEQRIVFRDENLELMDKFLTDGARSIPMYIGIDSEGNEKFRFGPRPRKGMEMLEKHKENPEVYTSDDFHNDLQLWYNKDKGEAIFDELLETMK